MDEKPHWEHGYRCHGYWLGGIRIGHVGLTPPRAERVEYTWDFHYQGKRSAGGCEESLRRAKRLVEKAFLTVSADE